MPKKSDTFSDSNLAAAIIAVDGGMSKKAAAKQFGVARSTIQFRIKNRDKETFSCGPSSVLSVEEEKSLVKWLLDCCKKGFPRRRITWYKSFLKRNPIISKRTSEHVSSASGNVSETNIKKWFDDIIYQYLTEEKLADILNDPPRVFNGDETGFSLCPKTKSVLGPRGAKVIYEIAKGNEKENITAMFTFNAAGQMCNPMIIFKYQRIPPNWGVGRSDRILQPADVSAFRPLKSGWKKGLSEWRNQNPTSSVTK
ncbi:unnamed protein product [Macrosiphum euphorbiae]|uniref:HTH psq-type domain-containing protein n=1 Tax=Macrosiphum euphorbiae TaxID=13131 RepID=A0AAV0Y400_9HEMI|nr:unnamed protein product [Macrosiphum euphorbiae]